VLEDVIACPNPDHGTLIRTDDSYTCERCGATFPIRNGIPVLLPSSTVDNG
jgi:uncharacterized protein YbaR (Trm112 family)